LLAAILVSCIGVVGDPGVTGAGPATGEGPFEEVTTELCAERAPSVGPAPLLRLTRRQYGFTLHDALAVDAPVEQLPVDANEGGFAGSAVSGIVSCTEDACADALVDAVGLRLFRRPLVADERERYTTLFTTSRTELALGVGESASLVLEVMLQSPSFLVRMERGVAERRPDSPPVSTRSSSLRASRTSSGSAAPTPSCSRLRGTGGSRRPTESKRRRAACSPTPAPSDRSWTSTGSGSGSARETARSG
jgi:hypothetical protein